MIGSFIVLLIVSVRHYTVLLTVCCRHSSEQLGGTKILGSMPSENSFEPKLLPAFKASELTREKLLELGSFYGIEQKKMND